MQLVPKPRCCWTAYCRSGQLFLLLKGHFEMAAFSGGPCLLMRVDAVSVCSLSTNIYCDCEKLEELPDLKIFLNASAGHWKRCARPNLARGPLFAHPWHTAGVPNLGCMYSQGVHLPIQRGTFEVSRRWE